MGKADKTGILRYLETFLHRPPCQNFVHRTHDKFSWEPNHHIYEYAADYLHNYMVLYICGWQIRTRIRWVDVRGKDPSRTVSVSLDRAYFERNAKWNVRAHFTPENLHVIGLRGLEPISRSRGCCEDKWRNIIIENSPLIEAMLLQDLYRCWSCVMENLTCQLQTRRVDDK